MDSSETKGTSKRLFIAIKPHLSESFLETYNLLKLKLGEHGFHWVPIENIHITMKFMGNTPEFYINSIVNTIKASLTNLKDFNIVIHSIGYFGKHQPKILWAGIKENKDLNLFQQQLDNNLHELGFDKENRSFSPHLTLCRIKKNISKDTIKQITRPFHLTTFQTDSIGEIILFESKTKPSGAFYEVIKTIKISGKN